MRSSSVTLDERDKVNWTGTTITARRRRRQMERSYSIGVMAFPNGIADKFAPLFRRSESHPDESTAPRSWMRASMRFVRPFQLADPPSPHSGGGGGGRPDSHSVQIHLPPLFPCDIADRSSSSCVGSVTAPAVVIDRPRQYGRSGQRRLSSRVGSVSSESQMSSVSVGSSWENSDTETITTAGDVSQREPPVVPVRRAHGVGGTGHFQPRTANTQQRRRQRSSASSSTGTGGGGSGSAGNESARSARR